MKRKLFAIFLTTIFVAAIAFPFCVQAQTKEQDVDVLKELEVTKVELAKAKAALEAERPTGEAAVSFMSMYYSKGQEFSANSLVIQPSITIGYKGFSINAWGNLDTKPYTGTDKALDSSNWNETDLTLSYSKSIGLFNLAGGYTYYAYGGYIANKTDDVRDQHDIFASVGLNTLLNPALTIYQMVDDGPRTHFLLSLSHTFELSTIIGLKLFASASYLLSETNADEGRATRNKTNDDGTVSADKYNNFLDGVISMSLPLKVTRNITITPSISYAFPLTDDAKNYFKANSLKYSGSGVGTSSFDEAHGSYLFGGINVSFAF